MKFSKTDGIWLPEICAFVVASFKLLRGVRFSIALEKESYAFLVWSVWIKAWHHHNLPWQISHKTRRAKDRLTQSAEALDSELKGCLGAPTGVCKKTCHQSQSQGINQKRMNTAVNCSTRSQSSPTAGASGEMVVSFQIYKKANQDSLCMAGLLTKGFTHTHLPSLREPRV